MKLIQRENRKREEIQLAYNTAHGQDKIRNEKVFNKL